MSQPWNCACRCPSACAMLVRPLGMRDDVDDRVGVDEAGARLDGPDRIHGRDGGAGQLHLQLVAAAPREGVEIGRVAPAPGEERDLVDRAVERHRRRSRPEPGGRPRPRTGRSGRRRRGARCRGRRASRNAAGPRSPACRSRGRPAAWAGSSTSRSVRARSRSGASASRPARCGSRGRRACGSRRPRDGRGRSRRSCRGGVRRCRRWVEDSMPPWKKLRNSVGGGAGRRSARTASNIACHCGTTAATA